MSEPITPEAQHPSVVEVLDEHGNTHWTGYGSEAHQRLRERTEEVADAGTEVPVPGGDPDPGSDDGGPGDGAGADDSGDGGPDDGVPGTETGGRTGKRR